MRGKRALVASIGIVFAFLLGASCRERPRTVAIHEAEWESGEIRVDGTAPDRDGAQITLANADTGEILGETLVAGGGSWSFACSAGGPACGGGSGAPIQVPCRVEARLAGSIADQRALDEAPPDCALRLPDDPPSCEITSPLADRVGPDALAPGASLAFTAAASDPEGLPVQVAWDFGGGADLRPTELDAGSVAFDGVGRFRVTFTAIDVEGQRCTAARRIDVGPVPSDLPAAVGQEPAPGAPGAGGGGHTVLAFNDLGMHCADLGSQPFEILPPFNTLNAQVIERGGVGAAAPRLLEEGEVELVYSAASSALDPANPGSINSTSVNWPVGSPAPAASLLKSDFWDPVGGDTVASLLFPGLDPLPDEGLMTIANADHGRFMPGIADPYFSNAPQEFSEFEAAFGWFTAQGVPVTAVDDAGYANSYPLMRVQALPNGGGAPLATVDAVVPVSAEVDCRDCHARGAVGADPSARPGGPVFVNPASPARAHVEAAAKLNILRLHDARYAATTGSLEAAEPVLCASCHGSAALSGVGGPGGDPAVSSMSSAMHAYHGLLQVDTAGALLRDGAGDPVLRDPADATAIPLVPAGPGVPMEQNCFLCHPGKVTQCFRGAMFAAGLDCGDCHGDMLAVGGVFGLRAPDGSAGAPRRPWLDEPRCESCHTGDAADHLPGPLVRSVAFEGDDPAATPVLASNRRFAEEPDTLYRNSRGHGGIACEGCHGSPHAIWPNPNPDANDNVPARQLQGHRGTLAECSTCHDPFGKNDGSLAGPHGMHPINDPWWIKGGERWHGKLAAEAEEAGQDACGACHGPDHRGTRLSRVPVDRVLRDSEGKVRAVVPAGTEISCGLCHSVEKSFSD